MAIGPGTPKNYRLGAMARPMLRLLPGDINRHFLTGSKNNLNIAFIRLSKSVIINAVN